MRQTDMTYGTLADFQGGQSRLRELILRNALALAGLVLLGAGIAMVVSLASWHADDPSLSYAADAPVRNLLGSPGAVFADLAMQLFGLAIMGFILPLFALGWNLLRRRLPRSARRQGAYWIGGITLLAVALACIPVPVGWPLPVGLGGAAGDLILRIPEAFSDGPMRGGLRAAIAIVAAIVAVPLLLAAGLRSEPLSERFMRQPKRPAPAKVRTAKPAAAAIEEDDADDDSRLRLIAGILAHWGLSARAAMARRLGQRRRAAQTGPARIEPRSEAGGRREPALSAFRAAPAEPAAETFDDTYESDMDGGIEAFDPNEDRDDGIVAAPPARRQAPARVPPPAPPVAAAPRSAPRMVQPKAAGGIELPPLDLLTPPDTRQRTLVDHAALEQDAHLLEGVLEDFGVRGEIINVRPGPVVTLYELEPAPGIKSSRVIGLADDIARSMSAIAARVAVVPGRNVIGIELPNATRETVYLRELLAAKDFEGSKAKLALALGKTIGGEAVIADLARMPHLLVAGTTGSGKSVSINTMILSLVYRMTPEQCRLIMIDPKMLELSVYDGIPHLLTPVVTDPKKAVVALKWTVREMEDRYRKMSKLGVRNIDGFNQRVSLALKKGEVITRTIQTGFDQETGEPLFETEELDLEPMPYIVVVIDEMADLMMVAGKEIEGAVQRLAQMARAAGIHVIMATQRPSVDVITGTIKANFPTRISFQVTSKIDSRTILGEQGAEQLLGQGDMLYMAGGGRIQRVHGPFVSDEEVEDIVAHLKSQGAPDYLDAVTDEDEAAEGSMESFTSGLEDSGDLYDKAVAVVLRDRKASTSYIQRRLSIGYNRAASLVERMEKEGLVGPANHAGKREILVGEDGAAA
ncbi:DNA translocase FtsK 4TM domain-containing protein [Faunimonas sp. B44]|uniref:DNA translocase FtsK 4TM domain-containing protein n=1 Tax=Faunimonas sp. B44 TaxID=3461493 RepID=UPI0040445397